MKSYFERLWVLLFPPKCILCRKILQKDETDLCAACRKDAPVHFKSNIKLSSVARWSAVWYYKDDVRKSILRFKFGNARHYAQGYARLLAMKELTEDHQVITWVPIGKKRLRQRGFDQCRLLAEAVGQELGIEPVQTLVKIKDTPPQSSIRQAHARWKNVKDAYRAVDPDLVAGKRVLLLDDVITTGATVSECAGVLRRAGAKEVICAAVAAASDDMKK